LSSPIAAPDGAGVSVIWLSRSFIEPPEIFQAPAYLKTPWRFIIDDFNRQTLRTYGGFAPIVGFDSKALALNQKPRLSWSGKSWT
jgi:hypothetical protein